jgi:hypothetical protein
MRDSRVKYGKGAVIVIVLILPFLLFGAINPAQVESATKKGQALVYGKTYGEWGAAWWQWALELDVAVSDHPFNMNDSASNVDCSLGQSGQVWFLAGVGDSLSGVSVTRTCTVPKNRALFFPLVNAVEIDPDTCTSSCRTVTEKREDLDFFLDIISLPLPDFYPCNLASTVDGMPTQHLYPIVRAQSEPFFVEVQNEILDPLIPDGNADDESVSDGYWIMIPPLSAGPHTIVIQGGICSDSTQFFEVDVTYNITVDSG